MTWQWGLGGGGLCEWPPALWFGGWSAAGEEAVLLRLRSSARVASAGYFSYFKIN